MDLYISMDMHMSICMGWLRSVGSMKWQVSFAEYRLFYRSLLQKRPIILSILLTVATPYILMQVWYALDMTLCVYSMWVLDVGTLCVLCVYSMYLMCVLHVCTICALCTLCVYIHKDALVQIHTDILWIYVDSNHSRVHIYKMYMYWEREREREKWGWRHAHKWTPQYAATLCNTLHHTATLGGRAKRKSLHRSHPLTECVHRIAAYCSVLQRVAACCNVLQRVVQWCQEEVDAPSKLASPQSIVCVSTSCESVLQCFQCDTVCCSVLQCVAVCCRVMSQCVVEEEEVAPSSKFSSPSIVCVCTSCESVYIRQCVCVCVCLCACVHVYALVGV